MMQFHRLGRWLSRSGAEGVPAERRRSLFAVLLFHFFFSNLLWLLVEGLTGEEIHSFGSGPYSSYPHYHFQLGNCSIFNLLRIHHLRHFNMLVSNTIVALYLLVLLNRRAQLSWVLGLWTLYIYVSSFYFGLFRPHLGTDKWFLVAPLQVFFSLGGHHGMACLALSFLMQISLLYARLRLPTPPLVLDSPANFVINFYFVSYVALACGGYEYTQNYALNRMEQALRETECANKRLKKAIKVKEQFLANISHELRTPMHGILATIEEMMHTRRVKQRRLREAIGIIADCSDHLCTVINDILDFQTLGRHQIHLEKIEFNLAEQLEQVCQAVQSSGYISRVRLEKHINLTQEERVGDPRRTRQIIFNILSNAFKFSVTEGKVTIDVREQSSNPNIIIIKITDTGIGMSDEIMQEIFGGFVQGDSSLRRNYGGSGLGLAISKRLVEAMGGNIRCESQLGQGSAFTIVLRLPAAPDMKSLSAKPSTMRQQTSFVLPQQGEAVNVKRNEEEETGENTRPQTPGEQGDESLGAQVHKEKERSLHEKEEAATERQTRGKRRVLLVEDNIVNQKVGVRMLESLGFNVVLAKNGLEAVNQMAKQFDRAVDGPANGKNIAEEGIEASHSMDRRHEEKSQEDQIDIVLMDCQMPVMDGFQAAQQIRTLEARQQNKVSSERPRIPILALTASATAEYHRKALAQGMDDFLTKVTHQNTFLPLARLTQI